MEAKELLLRIKKIGIDFFTGVPDSLLKNFCFELERDSTIKHITAANEGSAVALAAGSFLSSKNPSCVYMQNSGVGNATNPLVSLASEAVYNIPMLLIVGWRGEPGVKDEPQHKFQGEKTITMLESINVNVFEIFAEISTSDLDNLFIKIKSLLDSCQRVALLVRKGALLSNSMNIERTDNSGKISRESAIKILVKNLEINDIVVSTTGKISRELYEILIKEKGDAKQAFLTVGSMGHASMIALGIACNIKNNTVYCFDGDGAALMHLGSMATIADIKPQNFVHVLLNNSAHESVGGMRTTSRDISFWKMAATLNYDRTFIATNESEIIDVLNQIKNKKGLIFLEIIVANASRDDLIRPHESPIENRQKFMNFLEEKR